jgi:hypothetical protein
LHLKDTLAGHLWLTSVIPAIQEAEIRRIVVQSQSRKIDHETLSRKNPSQKRAEFKPQNHKK